MATTGHPGRLTSRTGFRAPAGTSPMRPKPTSGLVYPSCRREGGYFARRQEIRRNSDSGLLTNFRRPIGRFFHDSWVQYHDRPTREPPALVDLPNRALYEGRAGSSCSDGLRRYSSRFAPTSATVVAAAHPVPEIRTIRRLDRAVVETCYWPMAMVLLRARCGSSSYSPNPRIPSWLPT